MSKNRKERPEHINYMKNNHFAELTSYGAYLKVLTPDKIVTTTSLVDEEVIVGPIAEYIYHLEQRIDELEKELAEKK